MIARSTVTLPLTGEVVTEVKLASASARAARGAALNGKGKAVDPAALIAAEGAAKFARQGKLRDDAHARSLTSSEELVPISIWADFGAAHAPREDLIANSTLRATHLARTASRLHAVTSKVTRWLDARGYRTYDRGLETPMITADVPASALAALGRLDGVAVVHLRYPDVPAGFTWYDAVKGPTAHLIVGSVGGMAYCNGEGWQPDDYTYLNPHTTFDPTGDTNSHTRWTSELISATASTRMAPGAYPYFPNFVFTCCEKFSTWQWCFSNGINNFNRSAGSNTGAVGLQTEDMAQDYYAINWPYPTITLSAGNCYGSGGLVDCAQSLTGVHVTNRSYNTLIVGASDSNTTPWTSDDFLAEFSQYVNPVTNHNDFELPNLVAPGSDKYGTNISSASVVDRGTSASAPITLGTVMLMKARDSGFNSYPEMARATVLTASTHPVDGARTTAVGPADRKQGAGLLNAAVAVDLADPSFRVWNFNNPAVPRGHSGKWWDFAPGSVFDSATNFSAPHNISITSNGRLRVVAAWDATPHECSDIGVCLTDTLDADLDLWLSKSTGGGWEVACISGSWDSSWELCDIPVVAGETYKVELRKYSQTNPAGTFVGLSWNNYDPNYE